jgi:hypothetical protein
MMNVCIEWRIATVHQSAMTVNARLHKCHIRITPELYILNAALPHSVLVALTSSPRHSPLLLSQSYIPYLLLYQPTLLQPLQKYHK